MAIDPHNRTWQQVRTWATERMEAARNELEAETTTHTPEKDAARRRTLTLMRELLDMETQRDE